MFDVTDASVASELKGSRLDATGWAGPATSVSLKLVPKGASVVHNMGNERKMPQHWHTTN